MKKFVVALCITSLCSGIETILPREAVLMHEFVTKDSAPAGEPFVIDETIEKPVTQEPVPSKSLHVLYQTDFGRISRKKAITGRVNKRCGIYYNRPFSRRKIKPFIKKHNLNVDEIEKPVNEYKSFNDFFTRKLKPGARPIAKKDQDPNVMVSLADCSLSAISDISATDHFMIKGTDFTVEDFLNDAQLAQAYKGGTLFIFRLAPEDYHRFHFPFDCTPSKPILIKGIYDSVNPVVYKSGFQPLITNVRHLIKLKTDRFSTVIMVPVGALCVGKIVETFVPNIPHKKGDEAGYFGFGGSTVALLFKKGEVTIEPSILANTRKGIETKVRVGQRVARVA